MVYKITYGASLRQKYEPGTTVIIMLRDNEGVVQKAITEDSDILNKMSETQRIDHISYKIHAFITEDLDNYYDSIPDYVEPEYKTSRVDEYVELQNTLETRGELKVFIIASTKTGKGDNIYTYSDAKQRIKPRARKAGERIEKVRK